MADTSVTYVGDGTTKAFNVPFRYIETSHVVVEVNAILRLMPSDYSFTDATTVTFLIAPLQDAGILFRRVTPGDTRLVDFQNGAVLTEQDLDKAIDQVFFLAQEAKENYSDLLYAEQVRIGTATGIASTTPTEWLDSAVEKMLESAGASTLEQAIGDIDDNAESIIEITTLTDAMSAFYAVTLNVNNYITGFAQMNDGTTGSFVVMADKFAVVEPPAVWQASTGYSLNRILKNDNDVLFKCTTAGVSGSSEPTWDEDIGDTTTDGAAVWTAVADADFHSPFRVEDGTVFMQDVQIDGDLVVTGTITNDAIAEDSVVVTDFDYDNTQPSTLFEVADFWWTHENVTIEVEAGYPIVIMWMWRGSISEIDGFVRTQRKIDAGSYTTIGGEMQVIDLGGAGRYMMHTLGDNPTVSGTYTYVFSTKFVSPAVSQLHKGSFMSVQQFKR